MARSSSETTTIGETRALYADVPVELHKRARDRAYDERRSLAALVREAVERYLAGAEKAKEGAA